MKLKDMMQVKINKNVDGTIANVRNESTIIDENIEIL